MNHQIPLIQDWKKVYIPFLNVLHALLHYILYLCLVFMSFIKMTYGNVC